MYKLKNPNNPLSPDVWVPDERRAFLAFLAEQIRKYYRTGMKSHITPYANYLNGDYIEGDEGEPPRPYEQIKN